MSDDLSPVLSLPLIQPAQAQKHVTHNEALRMLDVLVQATVESRSQTAPPPFPAEGARFIVPPGATGAWAGQQTALAWREGDGWAFLAPLPGWRAHVLDEGAEAVFDGTAWTGPAERPAQLARLGLGTPADPAHRLALAGGSSLFSHAGAGHRITVNKAAPGDTASLLFQTGWSGRAELGTTGSDALALKVSADGAAWLTALALDPATGLASGTAVTAGAGDATPGRLMRVGDFGLGGLIVQQGDIGVTDNSLASGLYAYDTGLGSSGGPPGVIRGALIHLRRSPGGGETQLMLVESGTGPGLVAGTLFSRARVTGAWGPWHPPGVVEGGTNASGRYVRHQDGTQICWQTVTASAGGEATASFPAAFAHLTDLRTQLTVNSTANQALCPRFTARTLTGLAVSCFNAAGARVATAVEAVTIGRWF